MSINPILTESTTFNGLRINVNENKNCKYLCNKVADLIREEKVGAVFARDYIDISSEKETIKEKLVKLAIKFINK